MLGLNQPSVPKKLICGHCRHKCKNMKGLKKHNTSKHKGKKVKVFKPLSSASRTAPKKSLSPKSRSPKRKPSPKKPSKPGSKRKLTKKTKVILVYKYIRKKLRKEILLHLVCKLSQRSEKNTMILPGERKIYMQHVLLMEIPYCEDSRKSTERVSRRAPLRDK